MDDYAEKSCWNVTMWALLVFAGVLMLAYLFGHHEAAAVAANVTR